MITSLEEVNRESVTNKWRPNLVLLSANQSWADRSGFLQTELAGLEINSTDSFSIN